MVTSNVKGFKLEVTASQGVSRVVVRMADDSVIIDTDRVSITGLQNLVAVFESAARLAYREMDDYWRRKHNETV